MSADAAERAHAEAARLLSQASPMQSVPWVARLVRDVVDAALPLIEAAVRAQVAREIEEEAEGVALAAEVWRAHERDPYNTAAGADFDRINAEHRESFAKNLRRIAARITREGGNHD